MKISRIIISDVAFVFIIFLLVVLSVFSYNRIIDFDSNAERVTHTNLVKLTLEQALSNVKDAESGQRGFLLSKDSIHLQPYFQAVSLQEETLNVLDSIVSDDEVQKRDVKLLKWMISRRFDRLSTVIDSAGIVPLKITALINEGKVVMDGLRNLVAKMIATEDRLLVERTNSRNYSAYITPRYSLLLSVMAIIAVGIAYFLLRAEIRRRFLAEDTIKKLSEYFEDLPAAFSIVKGPQHIHELTNKMYDDITGNRSLMGKTFAEGMPELKEQGLVDLLDNVYTTGTTFNGKEMPITINKGNGELVKGYYNFLLQPIVGQAKEATGILIFGYEITEMIEARRIVEDTEQRSRLAIEAANIGTFNWDMENQQFISSPRLINIFGFNATDAITHQELINTLHPEDKPARDKAVAEAVTNGSLQYEARIIHPDQTIHWINVYGKIIHSPNAEIMSMYGTVLDVTEQRTILEELKKSEAQFRLLADSMPQFVWTADVDGVLNYFSKILIEYSGLSHSDFLQNAWIEIVHPDEREENMKRWMNAVVTGDEFIFEHRIKNHQQEYRWFLSRALPQKGPAGEIQRWVGTSTDIQEQKNFSQQLEKQIDERTKELKELNRLLVVKNNIFAEAEINALIGSYSWSLHTGNLEYSDNLFRLFGFEPNEFVPSFEKFHSLIHPDDQEQVKQDGIETIHTQKLVSHTYRIITKNGKIKHFRSTGKFLGIAENTLLVGTVQDISQDKLNNELLVAKNLELESSNTELESFNYIASHDLQEPLRKIQAFSQRILSKESQNFTQFSLDYFNRINAAAARMQNLIDALLSYSRANASNLADELTSLQEVAENVIFELQDMINEKYGVVNVSPLPQLKVMRIQVHQLFTNLIGNALKYSRANVLPEINITAVMVNGRDVEDANADVNESYWCVSIADNGIGFEQQYQKKIFELFQRLHGNADYIGTGIGLAICKKIMRNHKGFINATGVPGQGSTFNIYFPAGL